MTIGKHLTTFAGRPVKDYDPDTKQKPTKKHVFRIALAHEYGEEEKQTFAEMLDGFLTRHGGPDLTALVVGAWDYEDMLDGAEDVTEALVGARDRMPNLRAPFMGDITYDECEMSWIQYGDVSPLLPAFPKLEEFHIRGTSNLTFGKINHPKLKTLVIQSGGLAAALLNEVWDAKLPKLEHLELWLGDQYYGGITQPAPLKKLLTGKRFPKLKYLGLRNTKAADKIAVAVAKSPLLKRLQVLDMSLGAIGDDAAKALAASPYARKLKTLDLHHNYLTDEGVKELKKLKVKLDVSERKQEERFEGDDEVYRYITVSE